MAGLVAVVVDLVLPFPVDTNEPRPVSAMYYPVLAVVAVVAEVTRHVLPLTLVSVVY